jgi:hypothetical protein
LCVECRLWMLAFGFLLKLGCFRLTLVLLLKQEEEEEEGPLAVAPYGMTFVGTARLRATLVPRAQVDDVMILTSLLAVPRSADSGQAHDKVSTRSQRGKKGYV